MVVGSSRVDPNRRQIGHARWMTWLLSLSAPGFTLLLVAATWQIVTSNKAGTISTALILLGLWVVFIGLLIVPSWWFVLRLWQGKPALQVDAWGLVWGDDWSRDLAIEWNDIAGIGSRMIGSHYYSDTALLIHPRDLRLPPGLSQPLRLAARVNRAIYGTPYTIGLRTLRIQRGELLSLLRQHFGGPIDPTPFA
jgi:hypothetical protein